MAGFSFKKVCSILTVFISVLALTGCGEGDGPTRILNTAAPPVPTLPPGACDPINFEEFCPSRIASLEEFQGGPITILDNPQVDANNDSAVVARMQKFRADSGATFGGGTLNLTTPFVVAAGSSFTMNVWSPRPVPVQFQAGIATVNANHGGTGWEVLTFDLGNAAGDVDSISIIFDNGTNGNAGVDPDNWTFYFDDITLVPPGNAAVPIDPDVSLYDPPGAPDLVADVTAFSSQSVINEMFADDTTYSEVLAVSSGVGSGANVAKVGFIGFDPGFVTFYETLDFKVKGMPNFVIFVTLYEGGDPVRINLTSSSFSNELENGWYQVSIPLSSFTGLTSATGIVFESDDTAPMQFTFFMNDIGFGEADGDPGGGGPFDDGLLTNGDFEAGVSPWLLGLSNPIGAENVVDENGNNVFFVDVEAAGNSFDVNLSQKLAITPGETYTLTFKAKSNVTRSMLAGIGQSGGNFFSATQSVDLTTEWQTFEIEVTATDDNGGGDFGESDSRVLFDMGAEIGQVFIDDVSLVVSGGGSGGGDGTFVNGDFETGDFTGWTVGQNGTVTIETDTLDGRTGTFGRLRTTAAPQDVFLSQVALAAGTVVPGDSIEVSFDLYGALTGISGVVFVEVIFLNAAGQDEGGRDFVGPDAPYTPTDSWTTYSDTVIAGTGFVGGPYDVSGGVTLQLKAACGGVPGCGVDAYFDNVTFVINP